MKKVCLISAFVPCLLLGCAVLTGCGKIEHPDVILNEHIQSQALHVGNGAEPQDLDPQLVTGSVEYHILCSLLEGLVSQDPNDLHPIPGAAESWDVSSDNLTYTFHLRKNGKWSNGEPVTARDFINSYKRILTPSLLSEDAYMLYVVTNAEAFNTGKLKNFDEVGFKAIDDRTLEIKLNAPTPYFLALLNHHSWFPVYLPAIEKHGKVYERGGNTWTRPENYVGNGPFTLAEWKPNQIIRVKKNPNYWDAATVKLNEIYFHPIEREDTEERAFRTGRVDVTQTIPTTKLAVYKREHPDWLKIEPFLTVYFYRINVTKPPLNDKRVRQALAMVIDRKGIIKALLRAGQLPALSFVPPGLPGYKPGAEIDPDIEKAKKLLAEAGYPEGKGMPPVEILFNTLETHRSIAEAVQQMWKKKLKIDARLQNQEWKVYLDSQRELNYQVCRAAWTGDYPDPNTFLDMFLTGGGNNETGWSNKEYDSLIQKAALTANPEQRMKIFEKAEALLLDEMPIIPIYFYTRNFLIKPEVKGWGNNILDFHAYKYVYLEGAK